MLPGLEGETVACGRHCYKMSAILRHLRSADRRSPPAPHSMLLLAEDLSQAPCVFLEGNHRYTASSPRTLSSLASGLSPRAAPALSWCACPHDGALTLPACLQGGASLALRTGKWRGA